MEKRSTRSMGKKFSTSNLLGCNRCKEIEDTQFKRTLIESRGNEDDYDELQELDRKLKQLRGHICNSDYVNFDNYSDEEMLDDYEYDPRPIIQTRSITKGSNRRQGTPRRSRLRYVQSEVRCNRFKPQFLERK